MVAKGKQVLKASCKEGAKFRYGEISKRFENELILQALLKTQVTLAILIVQDLIAAARHWTFQWGLGAVLQQARWLLIVYKSQI